MITIHGGDRQQGNAIERERMDIRQVKQSELPDPSAERGDGRFR